jgi:hypothetical protein
MLSVYVPTTPNPTSGFFLMMPRADVIELQMSVDEALKYVISMGVVAPPPPPRHRRWPEIDRAGPPGDRPVLRACDTARVMPSPPRPRAPRRLPTESLE